MSEKYYVGIDIGGTTAKIGLVDSYGTIVDKTQVKTQKNLKWEKIIDSFVKPVEDWKDKGYSINGIGIGAPGAFDKNTRMLTNCPNIAELTNVPFVDYISKKLDIQVIGDNDATCAAVGEHVFGAGKKYENFVFVTVGTGIGGGIILNNKVYRGKDGYAGELGHVIAVPDGRECNCGNKGCIERYASATAIIKTITDGIKRGDVTSYSGVNIEDIDAKMIFNRAKDGDIDSINAVDTACRYLGHVMGSVVNLLNLDAVIIGGGVAAAGNYYIEKVDYFLKQVGWISFCKNLKVLPAELLNDAGIIGAASLILEDIKHQ